MTREATATDNKNAYNAQSLTKQYLAFVVDKEEYAINILNVMEIRNWEQPTVIPDSPPGIKGVMNLRGLMVPILDLRERFGLKPKEYGKFTVIVIVQIDASDKNKVLGLIVDAMSEVYSIVADQQKDVPESATQDTQNYVTSIAVHEDKSIILLDCTKLLSQQFTEELEKIKRQA